VQANQSQLAAKGLLLKHSKETKRWSTAACMTDATAKTKYLISVHLNYTPTGRLRNRFTSSM
jgi:hypothetical protein